ncbi:MAG: tetratricopeptide repeat protein [Flaviaesturariibacter sp.]|nr:tetratricopeptide repeat protein [Flaviaesturariibacter sp.]
MVHDEQLVRYLDGDLDEAEKKGVEEALGSDADLRATYERLQLTRDAIMIHGIREQVATVRKARGKDETYVPARVVPMRRWARFALGVAASVLVVLLCVKGFQVYRLRPENVYAETMVHYNPDQSRSGGAANEPWEQAYLAGDYKGAIRLAPSAAATAKKQLLVSLAHLETGQTSEAISGLTPLLSDSVYGQDAQFYLGMAYLRSKQYDAALSMLSPIEKEPAHLYHHQVTRSLLNDISWLKRKS